MPTLRPGLGPSLRSSRRTRTSGHSRASHSPVPSVLATSTTVMRSGGQPASASDASVRRQDVEVVVRDDGDVDVGGKRFRLPGPVIERR